MLLSSDLPEKKLEKFKGTLEYARINSVDWQSFSGVSGSQNTAISAEERRLRILEARLRMREARLESIRERDNYPPQGNTEAMIDLTRDELNSTLSALEERMDKRVERMERDAEKRAGDYKAELALRDEQIRRELDLRQQSFRAEQAARDAALNEKFAGFLAAQTERDKALEKISDARFERIEKDIGSIKTDSKKVSDDVNGIKVTMAKYLGAAVVIGALASAALGAAAKHLLG